MLSARNAPRLCCRRCLSLRFAVSTAFKTRPCPLIRPVHFWVTDRKHTHKKNLHPIGLYFCGGWGRYQLSCQLVVSCRRLPSIGFIGCPERAQLQRSFKLNRDPPGSFCSLTDATMEMLLRFISGSRGGFLIWEGELCKSLPKRKSGLVDKLDHANQGPKE